MVQLLLVQSLWYGDMQLTINRLSINPTCEQKLNSNIITTIIIAWLFRGTKFSRIDLEPQCLGIIPSNTV